MRGQGGADTAATTWDSVRNDVRSEVGEACYRSWIGVLSLHSVASGCVEIGAPNRFICDRVADRFRGRLQELWARHDDSIKSVAIVVSKPCAASITSPALNGHDLDAQTAQPEVRLKHADQSKKSASKPAAKRSAAPKTPASNDIGSPARLSLGLAVDDDEANEGSDDLNSTLPDPKHRFDSFVVGGSNQLANAAARRVAESLNPEAAYNPLFLYGGVGLGKTHLMQAIAWEAQERFPNKRVAYLTAEKFMHRFVSALRYKDTFAFKQEFRSVDLLLVDDFQFIGGKDATQEEFFHTFNALIDENRQIVISADRSPSDLEGVEERIKSRLNWGLVADIGPTDYELRLGILQAKAQDALDASPNLRLGPKVLEFIAHKLVANARVLEGALKRLVAHANLGGREVTVEMAQETLTDLVRAYDRRVTIEEIQRKVAEHYNIKFSDMSSPRRARAVARPRQVAMYVCKEMTDKSLPEIGRKFGGRDHTTIMYGIDRITELLESDPAIREDVQVLKRALAG